MFSDSDTTGTSSALESSVEQEAAAADWRTQSDYDDAWVMQLVNQVDQFMKEQHGRAITNSWIALKNVISMHHAAVRTLRRAVEEAEQQALMDQRARQRAETRLQELGAMIVREVAALNMSDSE